MNIAAREKGFLWCIGSKLSLDQPQHQNDLLELLRYHRLLGWAYSLRKDELPNPIFTEAKKQWHWQLLWNQLQRDELYQLGSKFKEQGVEPVILKGFAMIGDIYPDIASRYTSDIDILIKDNQKDVVDNVLTYSGFERLVEPRWAGNIHKDVYSKWGNEGVEIQIEVHQQLFSPSFQSDLSWEFEKHEISGFLKFSPADHLYHLGLHSVFQHNLTHLYWLIDVDEFLRKTQNELNWERFYQLVKQTKLENSFYFLKRSLDLIFSRQSKDFSFNVSPLNRFLIDKCLNLEYLIYPYRQKLRYQFLKHVKNPTILTALRYDFAWMFARMRLGRENL